MSNEKTKRKFSLGLFYSKFGIFLILAAVFIIAAIAVPNFASKRNLMNILIAISCTTVLAFGATFIIILGHINIAYGSQIAFIGCAAVLVNVATGSVWAAIPVALVLGLFFGGLSGFFITKFNTPAFIMTLALTEACRGGAVLITGGTTVQGMTPDFAFVGQGYVGPVPMSIIIMAICFAIMWVILNKTVFGRHVYAVGGNANAAKASGIKTGFVILMAQFIGGAIAGMGGAIEIVGVYKRFQWQSQTAYVWDGLLIYMLANGNPTFIPLTAFFIAYLRVGAEIMSRSTDLDPEIVTFLQGIIILLVASQRFLYFIKKRHDQKMSLRQAEAEEGGAAA